MHVSFAVCPGDGGFRRPGYCLLRCVSRDHRQLRAFQAADDLVVRVYQMTERMPASERFGLQGQLQRAAVSVTANIVEGCSRPGARDYRRFLHIALGSARECAYLLDLCGRLALLPIADGEPAVRRYEQLQASLHALERGIALAERSATSRRTGNQA